MKLHHEDPKAIINRLSRAIGHLEHVKSMVEDDKDCSEILIQIAAVKSAVNRIGNQILKDHILHCVLDPDGENGEMLFNDLADAIDQYVK